MVFTRSQIENLSREEVIEELVKLSDITDRLKELTDKFNNFSKKYEELKSDLVVTKKCNSLLYSHIVQLEKNTVSNALYHRRETLKLSPVPQDIHDNIGGYTMSGFVVNWSRSCTQRSTCVSPNVRS